MTTREFVRSIVGQSEPEVYRRLLVFLEHWSDGYGANDGERGEARRFAANHGYFWLPCIICGEWRGGHEPYAVLMLRPVPATANGRPRIGVMVCEKCGPEAERLNRLYPNGLEGEK